MFKNFFFMSMFMQIELHSTPQNPSKFLLFFSRYKDDLSEPIVKRQRVIKKKNSFHKEMIDKETYLTLDMKETKKEIF